MGAKEKQVVGQAFRLLSNLHRRVAWPHDDFDLLTGRAEHWGAKTAHILRYLVRISGNKDRNTTRAFDRQWSRGLVNVEQGEVRRVPPRQSHTVSQRIK